MNKDFWFGIVTGMLALLVTEVIYSTFVYFHILHEAMK